MRWKCWLGLIQVVIVNAGILPPPWADPTVNPCAAQPGGWLKLYWPQDGRCYRIFKRGPPCPETMELSPGQAGAECRCPPGQVQINENSICHQIHTKGPCRRGQYLAPVYDNNRGRWGECLDIPNCPQAGYLFWPGERKCYEEYSKGPCPSGQILSFNNNTGLTECSCDSSGPLSRYYWGPSRSCHQFYTRGPCLDKGALFLPGPQCGCHPGLPNYHVETEQCYEIGGPGPCKAGHVFKAEPGEAAGCVCKPEHVPWLDGHCYRVFTQGPCPSGKFMVPAGICQELPCTRGMLYFPQHDSCHRLGVRGPCPRGQLVLFEQSVKPSVEGISYRGMCGCPASEDCSRMTDEDEGRSSISDENPVLKYNQMNYTTASLCEHKDGVENCHKLYTQGPCKSGEWLVPNRQGRTKRRAAKAQIPSAVGVYIGHRFNLEQATALKQAAETTQQSDVSDRRENKRGRCECRPGHRKMTNGNGCHLPLVELAKFLNGEDYFT